MTKHRASGRFIGFVRFFRRLTSKKSDIRGAKKSDIIGPNKNLAVSATASTAAGLVAGAHAVCWSNCYFVSWSSCWSDLLTPTSVHPVQFYSAEDHASRLIAQTRTPLEAMILKGDEQIEFMRLHEVARTMDNWISLVSFLFPYLLLP